MATPKRIILTGFMGTGKTAIGRLLARELGFEFIDIDAAIEKEQGLPVTEIFASQGEPAFRALEKNALQKALESFRIVVSTGGGAVLDPGNRALMKEKGFVVGLQASPEVILERLKDMTHRPLLAVKNKLKKIQELLSERSPYYKEADLIVETDGRKIEEIVGEIKGKIHEAD